MSILHQCLSHSCNSLAKGLDNIVALVEHYFMSSSFRFRFIDEVETTKTDRRKLVGLCLLSRCQSRHKDHVNYVCQSAKCFLNISIPRHAWGRSSTVACVSAMNSPQFARCSCRKPHDSSRDARHLVSDGQAISIQVRCTRPLRAQILRHRTIRRTIGSGDLIALTRFVSKVNCVTPQFPRKIAAALPLR